MMCEEFVRLSKVDVTGKFYRESIEPQYLEMGINKEAFVEQWLKDNKTNIVKAHAFDIDRSSRELALGECKTVELERVKKENERLQYEAETWKEKYEAANSTWKEAQNMVEVWKTDCIEAQKQAEQVEPLKDQISALENEIVRLKARLFDMLEKHDTLFSK